MARITITFGNTPTAEAGYQNIRMQGDFSDPFNPFVSGEVPEASAATAGVLRLTGDLSGTFSSPVVAQLRGTPVDSTTPTSGQFLMLISGAWKPHTIQSSDIPNLVSDLSTSFQLLTGKDVANGYPGLDASGLVPLSEIPDLSATYLTLTSAAATYLTITSAGSTYAPLASPALTGTPTCPTATALSDNTTIANTKYVDDAISTAVAGLSSTLAGDTDVHISSPLNGQALTYDSGTSKWINATPNTTLAGDTDVSISSPANRNLLIYSTTDNKWHNDVLVAGDIPNIAESQVTNLVSDLAATEKTAHKDAASGYAGLDSNTMLKVSEQQETVDAQTSTTDAIADADRGKVVTFSNTSATACTLPQAGSSSGTICPAGWWCDVVNLNTGTVTITPTTSTINTNTTLVLQKGQGGRLLSDGSNYIWIAGQPTTDTPNDADILTYVAADKRWESKSLGTLGGANASQLRGVNIASAASSPGNQDVLKYNSANADWEAVLTDGMEHGDSVWWVDSGYNELRDDFNLYLGSTSFPTTAQSTQIGELSWLFPGSSTNQRFYGGAPPYTGQFAWNNPATTAGGYDYLILNSMTGYAQYTHTAWALLDNPGWKASWVFKLAGGENQSGTNNANSLPYKKSLYVGLCGNNILALKDASSILFTPRPDVFLGVRYDTSTSPAGFCVSSVAAASGGNTTYTLAYTYSALTSALNGISVTIKGCGNAANNGTFTIQSVTTTTIVVNNASGVAESNVSSPINTGSARINLAAMPLTAVTQNSPASGQATYTALDVTTGQSSTTYGHGTNGAYIGQSVTIAGFTNAGNNGTFTIIGSTATSIIVANASAVTETHSGTATQSNGNCDDATFKFEVVMNNTYQNGCRHNAQGTVFDTSITPTQNTWYRLDMKMTAANTVVMTLTDSNNHTATHTFTTSQMDITKCFGGITFQSGAANYAPLNLATPSASSSGVPTVPKPNLVGGSQITIAGLTGATGTAFNGTWTLENYNDGGAVSSGGHCDLWITTANVSASGTPTSVLAYPALTPYIAWGNDDCFGVSNQSQIWYTDFAIDFFALAWNKGIASPPTAPDATKVRYW